MRRAPAIHSPYLLELEPLLRAPPAAVPWSVIFAADRPLRIEIGVGNSPFLIEVALNEPAFNYLGFECSGKRVRKFLKKVELSRLENIRMLETDAGRALEGLVPPESVDHFFINFPDPWPKRRHAPKRFVGERNARLMSKLLRAGGGLSMRTDDAAYAAQMLAALEVCDGLANLAGRGAFAAAPLRSYSTPFELKFRAEGRTIYYLEYQKRMDHGS
jgi:tRNA (guanine-N7-)-methyltransferase